MLRFLHFEALGAVAAKQVLVGLLIAPNMVPVIAHADIARLPHRVGRHTHELVAPKPGIGAQVHQEGILRELVHCILDVHWFPIPTAQGA